jgi:hypothetical protein
MSRALSRSLAVVALLAVVSATLGVVSPSLARILERDGSRHAATPAWLWESHVYGGDSTPGERAAPAKRHTKRNRRPYTPPVARTADTLALHRSSPRYP